MLLYLLVLLSYSSVQISATNYEDSDSGGELAGNLVSSLRNDVNLDLPLDEDYEDIRAELLAYHTALATLPTRRSLITTPCWALGGICVNRLLCTGYKYLTEVPGCINKLNVCCFAWNRHQIRDMRDKNIGNLAFPWSLTHDFGGKGIEVVTEKAKKNNKSNANKTQAIAFLLRNNKFIVVYVLVFLIW